MRSLFRILICIVLILSFVHPAAARQQSPQQTRKEYISKYKEIAMRQMRRYGIPASIILAQACLESGNGNSRLAVKGNNHFGIKCHNWNGKTIRHNDDRRGECFRRYDSAEESFNDHSEFLRTGPRYRTLFDLSSTDYKAWAHGLKACGYATNPKYANILIEIIEANRLYEYDRQVSDASGNKSARQQLKEAKAEIKAARKAARQERRRERAARKAARLQQKGALVPVAAGTATAAADPPSQEPVRTGPPQTGNTPGDADLLVKSSSLYKCSLSREIFMDKNGNPYIRAAAGDTYARLAKEYNLFKREILRFNGLSRETPLQPGEIVYIKKPKK